MPIYGLYEQQHSALGDLIFKGGVIVRKPPSKTAKRAFVPGFVRVMTIADGYPIYTPRADRPVAYFERRTDLETITIEMFGSDLAGPIDVTIDGRSYTADCQAGTDELRSVFRFLLKVCRVTALPGLWEFAFTGVAPTITAKPAVGTSPTQTFSGGLVVNQEAWVSVSDGDANLASLDVVDAIPFVEGEVKRGSVGIAFWSDEIGWLVLQWQCREFSFLF